LLEPLLELSAVGNTLFHDYFMFHKLSKEPA
jgi:hypothetical protein